jgi:hypothetical protein
MKVLFLIKNQSEYGIYVGKPKAGLYNSANFVKEAISTLEGIEAFIEYCIDGNDVDRKLATFKPDLCIIEAFWVTPEKMREVQKLHPTVKFTVRSHSKIPFLATEGIAFDWLREYNKIPNVSISFNNVETFDNMNDIGLNNYFLPNIYKPVEKVTLNGITRLKSFLNGPKYLDKDIIKIGCFGAIRPLKNQLNQAVAAIMFGDANDINIEFYVNAGRIEQRGEEVLKNLQGLFKDTPHKLVELGWYDHAEFLTNVSDMDVCLQVSFTESFNIVSADSVYMGVPIVVSKEIDWMKNNIADPNNALGIANQIKNCLQYRDIIVKKNLKNLHNYNVDALDIWAKFLQED